MGRARRNRASAPFCDTLLYAQLSISSAAGKKRAPRQPQRSGDIFNINDVWWAWKWVWWHWHCGGKQWRMKKITAHNQVAAFCIAIKGIDLLGRISRTKGSVKNGGETRCKYDSAKAKKELCARS